MKKYAFGGKIRMKNIKSMQGGAVLIIGAGGVGSVVAHKCAQNAEVFKHIHLASKTKYKADAIKTDIKKRTGVAIHTYALDADKISSVEALIRKTKADVVINVALPYQNLPIMKACIKAGVHYIDTAIHESLEDSTYSYHHQQAFHDTFKKKGIMAVLGVGFDPGITNAYCAYILKRYFDTIRFVDILDANAGSHGKGFATNFNTEINIREVTQKVRHWREGAWVETVPVSQAESVHFTFDYPVVGPVESYMLYHEEMESLVKNLPGVERMRFWMTFSENYLNHLRVIESIGLNGIKPIEFDGKKVVPVQFLKALLPNPSSLAEHYSGKTVIGCIITGIKDGKESTKFIYNVCDHAESYREVGSQAISYTTGVPAMSAAKMILEGKWKGEGVYHVEELDSEPFLDTVAKNGLPFEVVDCQPLPEYL